MTVMGIELYKNKAASTPTMWGGGKQCWSNKGVTVLDT